VGAVQRLLLDEHFRVEGRKTWFETVEEMQTVLDSYLEGYNQRRPHQGRGMKGRTPATAFIEGLTKPTAEPALDAQPKPVSTSKRKEKRTVENQSSSIAI
jgi:hypothetical protein